MPNVSAFFSYSHMDDANEFLSKLRRDLCEEFRIISGSELNLFFDRDSIEWGSNWRNSIESGIANASFFIPVISPNFFLSNSCQAELHQYLAKTRSPELRDLMLPLLFSDVQTEYVQLDEGLVQRVLEYQYLDIQELRFIDRGSAAYVKRLNGIAKKILMSNDRLIKQAEAELSSQDRLPSGFAPNGTDQAVQDEPSGFFLDSAVEFEPTFGKMSKSLDKINQDVIEIGTIISKSGTEISARSAKGKIDPQVALCIAGNLAAELKPVSDRYARDVQNLLQVTEKATELLPPMINIWTKTGANNDGLRSLKGLIGPATTARENVVSFKESVGLVKGLSRSLFGTMRQIELSTSTCIAAIDIVISWNELLPEEKREVE